jgi:hypothetical protein
MGNVALFREAYIQQWTSFDMEYVNNNLMIEKARDSHWKTQNS